MTLSFPPTLLPGNLPRALECKVPRKLARDMKNLLLFGRRAPISDECIYVEPAEVQFSYTPGRHPGAPRFRRWHSGLVVGGDWDRAVSPLEGGFKNDACIAHFRDGVPWKETGIYDYLMADIRRKGTADGMRSLEELEQRYAALDRLYEEAQVLGRFRTRRELDGYFRREHGGIYIHVTRDGTPIKAGGGIHRLMIAQILGLRKVPAQLGVIHKQALEAGALERLRWPD